MMNLLPHHRIQVPNSLAIFAALLLLVTAFAGVGSNQESISSGQETEFSAKADSNIRQEVKSKSRGLKLGLLLFRRG